MKPDGYLIKRDQTTCLAPALIRCRETVLMARGGVPVSDNMIIVGLTTIVVLGVGAQWVGRRVGIPSLLLLLPAGLLAGALGLVDPYKMFGDLLFPAVTLLVSLLLFQSAIKLRVTDLPGDARKPVFRLTTVGLAITFVGGSLAVMWLFGVGADVAFLVGAILVVSGPTVVNPLLDVVRPRKPSGEILNWEGTALDPIGATLGVVMLNLLMASGRGGTHPVLQMLGRLGLGIVVGCVAAALLVFFMSRFLVTDSMEAAVALLFAVAAFAVADVILSEAGLFATTALGFVLANQRKVSTYRVEGFGKTIEVLIIGSLFIVLGALVKLDRLWEFAVPSLLLIAVLVLVVRPLASATSLVGTGLATRDRAFIGWLDPRGIVAAATAAQFSVTLSGGSFDSSFIAPAVFWVIIGTGVVYGLTATPVARLLGVREPPHRGVALIGDAPWLEDIARCLRSVGVSVLLMSIAPREDREAGKTGVQVLSVFDSPDQLYEAFDEASVSQIIMAAPPSLVTLLFGNSAVESLGRRGVLILPQTEEDVRHHLLPEFWSAQPFAPGITLVDIEERLAAGATFEFIDGALEAGMLPVAAVAPEGTVNLYPGGKRGPGSEDKVIALVGAAGDKTTKDGG